MFEKLLIILERIAAALEGGAEAAPAAAKKPRGRPAAGETNGVATAPSPEQLAAAPTAAAAQPASVQAATSVTTSPSVSAEKPVVTQPTLQQVADAIIAVANSIEPGKGRDAAVAILTKYGVKKVPELKPENFVAVLADVAALSAPSASAGLV